ncbi:unnamed protein product [Effrenium voratum]|nr:unnamed protein product [Effrenium voratum]
MREGLAMELPSPVLLQGHHRSGGFAKRMISAANALSGAFPLDWTGSEFARHSRGAQEHFSVQAPRAYLEMTRPAMGAAGRKGGAAMGRPLRLGEFELVAEQEDELHDVRMPNVTHDLEPAKVLDGKTIPTALAMPSAEDVADYWEVSFSQQGVRPCRIHVRLRTEFFLPSEGGPIPPGIAVHELEDERTTHVVPRHEARHIVVDNWWLDERRVMPYTWTGMTCFWVRRRPNREIAEEDQQVEVDDEGNVENSESEERTADQLVPSSGSAGPCTRSRSRSRTRSRTRRLHGEPDGWQQKLRWFWPLHYGVLVLSMVACMQNVFRPREGGRHGPHGPRSFARVGDAGPPFVGTATLKVPPAWSVERNHHYSFRSWVSDLVLWSSATEIDPRRQGPVAALQVQGSAKELVREITPQQLQDGDVDQLTGQHLTGLMLLVTVLARRYAPLDAENSTKAISEFLGFRRMPGETSLLPFMVLFHKMKASSMPWLREPGDQAMCEKGDINNPGNYLAYPTFDGPPDAGGANDPWLPGGGGDPWGGYRTTGNYHMDPNMCNFPWSYAAWNDDDGNSTNTSTDDEAPLDDPEANMTVEDAYQAYVFARKRRRRFAQKGPRRYRNKRSYASFLPPGAFAGGKGKSGGGGRIGHGKGKSGGFSRKNPKNKDGMIMKCHRCGSDEHLIKKCPMPDGGGQGHMHAAEKRPTLALTAMDPRSWSSGGLLPGVAFHTQARSTVSSTSFVNLELDKLRSVSQAGSEVSYAASRKRPEQSSVVSTPRRVRQARDGTPPAPTWSPGATSASWERPSTPAEEAEHFDLAKDDSTTSLQDPEIYPLVEGARDPLHPPPGRAPDLSTVQVREPEKEDEDLRQQNTAGLTKLLLGLDRRGGGSASGDDGRSSVFPWWESGQSKQATHQTYHLRTRIRNGEVGLLIDPGAHDNLVGEGTMLQMASQVNSQIHNQKLNRALDVEGVGQNSQRSVMSAKIEMALEATSGGLMGSSYTAPVIGGSNLPPLLGNKALRKHRAILDCASGTLILPGEGGVQMEGSPGTKVFALELADSGHFILPIKPREPPGLERGGLKSSKELDFAMGCRRVVEPAKTN